MTIPAATTIPPGGFFPTDPTFGLGNPDGVTLRNGATVLDEYHYADHALNTWGRCPDGTGAFVNTSAATKGAANSCPAPPVPAETWPGGSAFSTLDSTDMFGGKNLSGLAYQASGTRAKGVLWAVRNDPSTLYKLVPSGAAWSV